MERRGEEGCEGGKKHLILMDACIGCHKMYPIYYSNGLDFTVFINPSPSFVLCFLRPLSTFFFLSRNLSRTCINLSWVVNGYHWQKNQNRVVGPRPLSSLKQPFADMQWSVRCISEMTKFCPTVSDTSFVFILVSLPSVAKHTLHT